MKQVIVAGAGLMGTPAIYAFAKLGHRVLVYEPNAQVRKNAIDYILSIDKSLKDNIGLVNELNGVENVSLLFSAAPYHQNEKLAEYAMTHGMHYADLGGNPETSEHIQNLSKKLKRVAFTDLGLAPGFINILAEEMYEEYAQKGEVIKEVYLRVGGLPAFPKGLLNYRRTWSTDGLRNEYTGSCAVIRDGKPSERLALTEVEEVLFGDFTLEAFHTKGGLSHTEQSMLNRQVEVCDYKTLRYPGHAELLKFLLYECELDDISFDRAIANACPMTKNDIVFMSVQINDHRKLMKVIANENWTAMQKCTAFPAAAVASSISDGDYDEFMGTNKVPGYHNVWYDIMMESLGEIGDFKLINV